MASDWILYYWPGFPGRGDFVRLVFEEAGVKYQEENDTTIIVNEVLRGKREGYPMFAPPMIKKGDFAVSQSQAICRYLGEKFGLSPDTDEEKALGEQLSLCCHDYITEGWWSFYSIDARISYAEQKDATQPYIDRFVSSRLPKWLGYLERALKANNNGEGFAIGDKCTYVDLTLFHILRATEFQFPETWTEADYIPCLKAFKERIAARPNIASFLQSDRCKPFSGNGLM